MIGPRTMELVKSAYSSAKTSQKKTRDFPSPSSVPKYFCVRKLSILQKWKFPRTATYGHTSTFFFFVVKIISENFRISLAILFFLPTTIQHYFLIVSPFGFRNNSTTTTTTTIIEREREENIPTCQLLGGYNSQSQD